MRRRGGDSEQPVARHSADGRAVATYSTEDPTSWPLFCGVLVLVFATMDRIDGEISGWWGWPIGLVVGVAAWSWVMPAAAEVRRRSSFPKRRDQTELGDPTTVVCGLVGSLLALVSLWWLPHTWWADFVAAVAVFAAGVAVTELWRFIVTRRADPGVGEPGVESGR